MNDVRDACKEGNESWKCNSTQNPKPSNYPREGILDTKNGYDAIWEYVF